jgi:hypothetical protein
MPCVRVDFQPNAALHAMIINRVKAVAKDDDVVLPDAVADLKPADVMAMPWDTLTRHYFSMCRPIKVRAYEAMHSAVAKVTAAMDMIPLALLGKEGCLIFPEAGFTPSKCINILQNVTQGLDPTRKIPSVSTFKAVRQGREVDVVEMKMFIQPYSAELVLYNFVPLLERLADWVSNNPMDKDVHVVFVHGCIVCTNYVCRRFHWPPRDFDTLWTPLVTRHLTDATWPR